MNMTQFVREMTITPPHKQFDPPASAVPGPDHTSDCVCCVTYFTCIQVLLIQKCMQWRLATEYVRFDVCTVCDNE